MDGHNKVIPLKELFADRIGGMGSGTRGSYVSPAESERRSCRTVHMRIVTFPTLREAFATSCERELI